MTNEGAKGVKRPLVLHEARNKLAAWWWAMFVPLLFLVLFQTIFNKFGQGVDGLSGVAWLFQCTIPVGSLMLTVMALFHSSGREKVIIDNRASYHFGKYSIIVYYLLLYALILVEPFAPYKSIQLFSLSGWVLGPIQGVLMTIIGKFYIESIDVAPAGLAGNAD